MRIILEDEFAIEKGAGVGQHTLKLFKHLKEFQTIEKVEIRNKPLLSDLRPLAFRKIAFHIWLNSYLQYYSRKTKADIVHFTNFGSPILNLTKARYVVTIHDLNAWNFPETLPHNYIRYIKWATSRSIEKCDLILTVSNAIKEEIAKKFDIPEEKIKVVYNGLTHNFRKLATDELANKSNHLRERYGIEKDFILFVGTVEKRKNVLTLVKAFDRLLKQESSHLQLVLAGSKGGYGASEVESYIANNKLNNQVLLTGYVSVGDLVALYNLAKVFVFPSLYEGFGIPLLEAMACELPIVASRIPVTKEIAGDAVKYYGNARDEEALSVAILDVLNDTSLRGNLIAKGRKRVKKFSWKAVAKRHLEAYKQVLNS